MRVKSYVVKKIYIVLRRDRKTIRDKLYEIKKIYYWEEKERQWEINHMKSRRYI